MNNLILIAAMEARSAVEDAGDVSLEDKARAAMRAVQNHWALTDENGQLHAALEGLAQAVDGTERDRVIESTRKLARAANVLAALSTGVPVDFDSLSAELDAEKGDEVAPLHIRALWTEVAG